MLVEYENELRAVAERVAEAEREARRIVGDVAGREEKYTEVFRTKIEEKLENFHEGRVSWKVITYTTDKQSGEEKTTGADLVIAFDITLDGVAERKGILVQAKVNKAVRYGVSVDGVGRLRQQCREMKKHSSASYVFVYGNPITKVLSADGVITGAPLSKLSSKGVSEFFGDVMMCWAGDSTIRAATHGGLERLVKSMDARRGVLLKGALSPD
jgi:hypothetical protein